jgi:hypothetical protein
MIIFLNSTYALPDTTEQERKQRLVRFFQI